MNGQWKDFLAEWVKTSRETGGFDRTPLAGDASNRQYFRVQFSGSSPKTAILMEKNAGENFKKSEEAVSQSMEGPPGDPFILIGRFLREKNLPVPALYHVREDGSLILQEDLGDQTLYHRLILHPEEEEALTGSVLSLGRSGNKGRSRVPNPAARTNPQMFMILLPQAAAVGRGGSGHRGF